MKALLVDDSATMRKVVGLALKSGGIEFIESDNAENALSKINDEKFDFFLLDVNMPGMNGIELTKEIRKLDNYKKTPIIILTTESEKSLQEEGKKAGADDWIIKPFQKEELIDKIKKLM